MLERLKQPETRARIRADIERDGLNNWGRIPNWDCVQISISPNLPQYAGRTIAALAAERGTDPVDTLCDYLVDDQGATRVLVTSISEDDIERHRASTARAGRLRRQLRRALRHGRPGHAAPALLRHVPAHHRPLCARARRAAAGSSRSTR